MNRVFMLLCGAMIFALTASPRAVAPVTSQPVIISVDTTPAHRIQEIRPIRVFGTSIDVDETREVARHFSPAMIKLMLSTGLGTLTYRNNTELSIEDWHWNPAGQYSDAPNQEGYWTSNPDVGATPIMDSFGYGLPHRGSSRDQSRDDSYSRIDDGDPNTYWKSNPYLTHAYTGDADAANPQWVAIQFLEPHTINAIKIAWSNPYATHYQVQYWTGAPDAILNPADGEWHTFAHGTDNDGKGGDTLIKLDEKPVVTTFVRVLMSASSETCDSHGSSDRRNCLGYAIQDIGIGLLDGAGQFHDQVVRTTYGSCNGVVVCTPDPKRQTLMWTSSTDPWHSESDKVGSHDQVGFDRIAPSPLTRGLPTIYPVAVFYSTPENAANEIRYLEAHHYPVWYIEMGEEVDGQYALPEDYGALYIQFAKAIHAVDPNVKLGGPVFEGIDKDTPAWRDANGDASWLRRFVKYLDAHGHLQDLSFMSYEHYPYHNCDSGQKLRDDVLDEPSFVRRMANQWRADGITQPLLETENNFSADGTSAPQRIYGALWTGDFFGSSLASGISYITYFIGTVLPLDRADECNLWGSYSPYIVDRSYNVRAKGAAYYALQLVTQQWALPGDKPHGVYPVTTSLGDDKPLVTAYALERPDGMWSVLAVNKDAVARKIRIQFGDGGRGRYRGTVQVVTFGSEQYHWNGAGPHDVPKPDRGLARSSAPGGSTTYSLAPQSLTVFRGPIEH